MARELLHSWPAGRGRNTHKGFAAYKIIGKFNKPMERVGRIFDSAGMAVDAAERLGAGYAAFRVYDSKSGEQPLEMIQRADLPVEVSLNPQQRS